MNQGTGKILNNSAAGMIKRMAVAGAFVVLFVGCLGERNITRPESFYVLEYSAPAARGEVCSRDAITVDRFSATALYQGTAIMYKTGPYTRASYYYHRWKVSPAAMVSDLVRRDLALSGIFAVVRSGESVERSRYLLDGCVTEFLQTDENTGKFAVLGFTATLSDRRRRGASSQALFQKDYRVQMALDEGPPAVGLARAMSRAMEGLSKSLIEDIRAAVREDI